MPVNVEPVNHPNQANWAQPFEDWYRQIPIITKVYMTACVATSLAVYLDFVSPFDLYLNYPVIFRNWELWRILTNFFFFDYFGFNFFLHMYFFYRHSRMLEESSFRGRTADYLFMWLFGAILLLIIDFIFYYSPWFPRIMFLAPSLAFMVLYVWSKRNPHVSMSFLGLFTFTAPYLPWVILGFGMMLGQNPVFDALGIVIGHIYYFLEDVYPQTSGRRLLKTPGILKALVDPPIQPPVDVRPERPLNPVVGNQ